MRERGWGGSNSDEGTDTIVLFYVYKYFVIYNMPIKKIKRKCKADILAVSSDESGEGRYIFLSIHHIYIYVV